MTKNQSLNLQVILQVISQLTAGVPRLDIARAGVLEWNGRVLDVNERDRAQRVDAFGDELAVRVAPPGRRRKEIDRDARVRLARDAVANGREV